MRELSTMIEQPTAVRIRKFQPDDLPALVDVINRAAAFDQEDQFTTLEDLRCRFERPYFYPQDNCLIAAMGDKIAAYCTAELDPRVGQGWGTGCVVPDLRRRGIGRMLLRAADDRHQERAQTELAPDLPLIITRFCRDTNTGTVNLLESEGYQIVRISWSMHIDLDGPVDAPPLPEGVTLRPFDRARDAYGVFEAEEEMFRHNWGFVAPPYEVWQNIWLDARHQDALWLVAVAGDGAPGDPIVGLCLCKPKGDDQPQMGWVDSLAVRADWRKRGLGSALLRRGFQTLQAHGFTSIELGVDSENVTNAVALYERAGMHACYRHLFLRKALRGDPGAIWR
jgi:ribosomal protein S18 acetylase RimI-like enzyme